MSSLEAPAWALLADAIDGVGDTHLPAGIHVRALPSACLGVPATPLVVTRYVLDPGMVKEIALGSGVTWIDSQGHTLTAPFDVTPDNPVYGYFSEPDAIWAELSAVSGTVSTTPVPITTGTTTTTGTASLPTGASTTVHPASPTGPIVTPVTPVTPIPVRTTLPIPALNPATLQTATLAIHAAAPVPASAIHAAAAPASASTTTPLQAAAVLSGAAATRLQTGAVISQQVTPLHDVVLNPAVILAAAAAAQPALRFEALRNSEQGLAVFQAKSSAPYALAAWTIPLVRVVGTGRVNGIRWAYARQVQKYQRETAWEVWSMPVDPAPRYTPTVNARTEAKQRVDQAAVLRQPMYVAWTAASAAASPAAASVDADQRVAQVKPNLDRWLKILLNDLSQPTWKIQDKQAMAGPSPGSMGLPIEAFLLISSIDPDLGHYLGFGDVDTVVKPVAGSLVFYKVRGLWRWNPSQWNVAEQPAFAKAIRADAAAAVAQFPELEQYKIVPKEKGPFVDLFAGAVALAGQPGDKLPNPAFVSLDDRGWLSTPPPPAVRRALRLIASGFMPHALAALAAKDMNGERSLHSYPNGQHYQAGLPPPKGLPLPMVVSEPSDPVQSGEGRFEDRDAPASAVQYRLAQGDWFGRWGNWGYGNAADKARTPPMQPVIEIYPHVATWTPPKPVPQGMLAGQIELRIPMLTADDLPAGGAPVVRLDLLETFDGGPQVTVPFLLPNPANASIYFDPVSKRNILVIFRTGPLLMPSAKRKVSYTARWIDQFNAVSPDAYPANRTIIDPRAPAPPALKETLSYTSRPDAQGHARVDLSFTGLAGVRYRVFTSNETLLLKALDNMGSAGNADAAQLADQVRQTPAIEDRAAKLVARKDLFGWDHFESLTKEPLPGNGGTTHFVHRVSGALDVIIFYRVLGEGESGCLSELSETAMAPFGVPNLGGPARPLVSVLNAGLDPTTQGVKLRVKVPRGKAIPQYWRLRRTTTPVDDPLRMAIVDNGSVSNLVDESDGSSFDLQCAQPLKAWRQYRFSVEVQGQPPSGSVGLAGEWSDGSACAKLTVIPPGPPQAANAVQIENQPDGLHIAVLHPQPDSLNGTTMGSFGFETWRVEPGKRPIRLNLAFTLYAGTWRALDPSQAPAGTYVTLRVIDPVGRSSSATVSTPL